ncbi:MAG: ABC transporter ATP-binding protein [Vallitalea sp.]|jgi:NitT/TauT family transport system ATP-binding protein|nr:ABC transporter ATP-binding protein [Vallitalea sp.]
MININNISKRYNDLVIFDNFNLTIEEGKISCFLGESGCGKSTLLNMICGTVHSDKGYIEGLNNNFSYIFQDTRLLPWATVEENIKFVLKNISKKDADYITNKYLDIVKLSQYKEYYPKQLSGGMKQRVSIARAFAYKSEVLLMDEPFKGLDTSLKLDLIKSFIQLWEEDKRTVLFVTHDIEEALLLSDYIYIFKGRPVVIKDNIKIDIDKLDRLKSRKQLDIYRHSLAKY